MASNFLLSVTAKPVCWLTCRLSQAFTCSMQRSCVKFSYIFLFCSHWPSEKRILAYQLSLAQLEERKTVIVQRVIVYLEARGSIPRGETFLLPICVLSLWCCYRDIKILRFWSKFGFWAISWNCVSQRADAGATSMSRMLGKEASLCPIDWYWVCVVDGGGSAIIHLEDLGTWPMVHSSTRERCSNDDFTYWRVG